MGWIMTKPVLGFLTKSDTNWAVQPQKMARGLKLKKGRDFIIFTAKKSTDLICAFVFAYAKSRFFFMTLLILSMTMLMLR